MEFMPAGYRPLLHDTEVFSWPLQIGVCSWVYCSTCGRRVPRKRKKNEALGVQFTCPNTIIEQCKPEPFATGCSYDCYRQRDLETNGAYPKYSSDEIDSILQWRRKQRRLWELADSPDKYATGASYAQPQREDWPVYDPDGGVYVQWSPETKHLESMLELPDKSVQELRCIALSQKHAQERGKSKSGPTFN